MSNEAVGRLISFKSSGDKGSAIPIKMDSRLTVGASKRFNIQIPSTSKDGTDPTMQCSINHNQEDGLTLHTFQNTESIKVNDELLNKDEKRILKDKDFIQVGCKRMRVDFRKSTPVRRSERMNESAYGDMSIEMGQTAARTSPVKTPRQPNPIRVIEMLKEMDSQQTPSPVAVPKGTKRIKMTPAKPTPVVPAPMKKPALEAVVGADVTPKATPRRGRASNTQSEKVKELEQTPSRMTPVRESLISDDKTPKATLRRGRASNIQPEKVKESEQNPGKGCTPELVKECLVNLVDEIVAAEETPKSTKLIKMTPAKPSPIDSASMKEPALETVVGVDVAPKATPRRGRTSVQSEKVSEPTPLKVTSAIPSPIVPASVKKSVLETEVSADVTPKPTPRRGRTSVQSEKVKVSEPTPLKMTSPVPSSVVPAPVKKPVLETVVGANVTPKSTPRRARASNIQSEKVKETEPTPLRMTPAIPSPIASVKEPALETLISEKEEIPIDEYCQICRDGGELILCDKCPLAYHLECLSPPLDCVPEGDWFCPACFVPPKKGKKKAGSSTEIIKSEAPTSKRGRKVESTDESESDQAAQNKSHKTPSPVAVRPSAARKGKKAKLDEQPELAAQIEHPKTGRRGKKAETIKECGTETDVEVEAPKPDRRRKKAEPVKESEPEQVVADDPPKVEKKGKKTKSIEDSKPEPVEPPKTGKRGKKSEPTNDPNSERAEEKGEPAKAIDPQPEVEPPKLGKKGKKGGPIKESEPEPTVDVEPPKTGKRGKKTAPIKSEASTSKRGRKVESTEESESDQAAQEEIPKTSSPAACQQPAAKKGKKAKLDELPVQIEHPKTGRRVKQAETVKQREIETDVEVEAPKRDRRMKKAEPLKESEREVEVDPPKVGKKGKKTKSIEESKPQQTVEVEHPKTGKRGKKSEPTNAPSSDRGEKKDEPDKTSDPEPEVDPRKAGRKGKKSESIKESKPEPMVEPPKTGKRGKKTAPIEETESEASAPKKSRKAQVSSPDLESPAPKKGKKSAATSVKPENTGDIKTKSAPTKKKVQFKDEPAPRTTRAASRK